MVKLTPKSTIESTGPNGGKKKKKDAWGIVIAISIVVFLLSQLINICLSKMAQEEETSNNFSRYDRRGMNISGSYGRYQSRTLRPNKRTKIFNNEELN